MYSSAARREALRRWIDNCPNQMYAALCFQGGAAFGSYEELAGAGGIDLVYVATPHPQHAANALLALNAGKGPGAYSKPGFGATISQH